MRKIYFFICVPVILCMSANAQVFSLLKDINPGLNDGIYNGVNYFTNLKGTFYFIANDGTTGPELWKSDGTAAGTVMVKDINPGTFGSTPLHLFVAGDVFYFSGGTETKGFELWKSDGTAAGTVMVKDINPNGNGSSVPLNFVSVGNTVYFCADDGITGRELWKSDGTAAGTMLVKDINPGLPMSQPELLTPVGNEVYFTAATAANGRELWKTDGTPGGTVLVKDLNPGMADSEVDNLVNVKNTLFFRAISPGEGLTLMKTNGTTAGTVVVKPGNLVFEPGRLANVGGTLYFTSSGDELWKSDGTPAGTMMLKDLQPGISVTKGILRIIDVNGTAFFSGNNGLTGREIWKSDGTAAGTVMVKDINTGIAGSDPERDFYPVGNYLLFSADDGISGRELWISDGTSDGTFKIQDILPGALGSEPLSIIEINGKVYISAIDAVAGREIFSACFCFKKRDIRNAETLVMLYPNPLRETGTLLVCVAEKENIVYRIYDETGRLMQTKSVALNEGSNYIPIQTSLLATGAYIIAVDGSNDNTKKRIKFLKQ